MQDAPAGDVVLAGGDVLALPVGVDARGEAVHVAKPVVASSARTAEAVARELAHRAYLF